MSKPSDVDKATKKYSALRDASRAERAEFYFDPFCQLAPAFNGRGLFRLGSNEATYGLREGGAGLHRNRPAAGKAMISPR